MQNESAQEGGGEAEIVAAECRNQQPYDQAAGADRVGVWEWDLETQVLFLDPLLKAMLGYDAPDIEDRMEAWQALWHPDDREQVIAALSMHLQGATPALEVEHRMIHRDGSLRWFVCRGRAIRERQGKPIRLIGAHTNITERKQLEQALRAREETLRNSEEQIRLHNEELEHLVRRRTARIRELERQRAEIEKLAATGRMAAGIAHEINNPLASIMSSFELVSAAIPEDHPRYDFVRRIEKDLDRVAMIIRQMYNLYKPVQEAAQTFGVVAMLAEVQLLLESLSRQCEVGLEIKTSGVDEAVCLPPTSVHQVLFNVIQNAIDASPPGGVVTVTAETVDGWLHVAVEDQGCGIEGEVRHQIFEPFFSTKQAGSMGLGLAIARSLATAMGGSIMFESEQGEATVFHITLPLRLELYAEIEQALNVHAPHPAS